MTARDSNYNSLLQKLYLSTTFHRGLLCDDSILDELERTPY